MHVCDILRPDGCGSPIVNADDFYQKFILEEVRAGVFRSRFISSLLAIISGDLLEPPQQFVGVHPFFPRQLQLCDTDITVAAGYFEYLFIVGTDGARLFLVWRGFWFDSIDFQYRGRFTPYQFGPRCRIRTQAPDQVVDFVTALCPIDTAGLFEDFGSSLQSGRVRLRRGNRSRGAGGAFLDG